jgi:hypothetical protein
MMNKRIRELAEQARDYAEEKQNDPYRIYTLDCFNEKFAELIVRECLLSLEPDLYSKEIDYEFEQRFYKRCRDKILKHFGVEE